VVIYTLQAEFISSAKELNIYFVFGSWDNVVETVARIQAAQHRNICAIRDKVFLFSNASRLDIGSSQLFSRG
jgi:hypothetical protein